MACTGYIKGNYSPEKIKLADIAAQIPIDSFFDRGIADDDCGELVNLALSIPGIDVVAAGPPSCSRVLYFRAVQKALNERLFLFTSADTDLAGGRHGDRLAEALEGLAALGRSKAIIVYITCADILTGTDFTSLVNGLESRYGIAVKIFERGPLSRRRMLPKERLGNIFITLLQRGHHSKFKSSVNILGERGQLPPDSGLRRLLRTYCPAESIREFAALAGYEEFEDLPNSRLNIALDRFGYNLAVGMREKWGIPFLFLPERYNREEIAANYAALQKGLQVRGDSGFPKESEEYQRVAAQAAQELSGKKIAVGIGPRSFELAQALELLGLPVAAIFAETISKQDKVYIEGLSAAGSQAEVYLASNITAETQREGFKGIDIAVGKKAGFYCLSARELAVSADYHFGYEGIVKILEDMG